MRLSSLRSLALVAAAPLLALDGAAQGNPWAIDLGSHRSVAVTWRGAGNIEMDGRVLGSGRTTAQALFTPRAVRMTLAIATTIQGRSDSGTAWSVASGDTESSDNGTDTVTVEPSFRGQLAREFDALAPGARAKVLANLRAMGNIAVDELDALPSAVGEKAGAATVAGQACDIYTTGETSICVLRQAPAVMLRFRMGEGSYELVASEIRFDVPVPADAFTAPRGKVVLRLSDEDVIRDRTWAVDLYAERNDGNEPPSFAALAKFVVHHLATEDVEPEPEGEPGEP